MNQQHPETVAAVDMQLRQRRMASETRTYERELAAWQSRRDSYEAQTGYSPEEWQRAYTKAIGELDAADERAQETRQKVTDAVKQKLQAEYPALASEVSNARQDLDQAGLFSRPAARRALAEAEARFEAAFGFPPGPVLGSEPSENLSSTASHHALKVPEVQQLDKAWEEAVDTAARLDFVKPSMCTERDRPKLAKAGTPEQEAAKDRAFAGRTAQNKRANAAGPAKASAPSPSRGPEH